MHRFTENIYQQIYQEMKKCETRPSHFFRSTTQVDHDLGIWFQTFSFLYKSTMHRFIENIMNETTLEDESKLMLDAYLTETGGSCDFVGKDQLYQERDNEIALPSSTESKRRIDIEQQLLLEQKESETKRIQGICHTSGWNS